MPTASQDTVNELCRVSGQYLLSRSEWGKAGVFCASFLSLFWFLCLFFLLGYFPVGKWTALFLLWFRGLGCGFSMVSIYYQNGREIVRYMAATVLPVALCQTLVLLFAARWVWWYRQAPAQRTAGYRLRFLLLAAISAAAALLDMFLSQQ